MPSIAVTPVRDLCFLADEAEADCKEEPSSRAEYLRLLLEAAEIEVEVDKGTALVHTGDGGRTMEDGGGRTMVSLSGLFWSSGLFWLLLLSSVLPLLSCAFSCSFPFPFPFFFDLPPFLDRTLGGGGIFAVAP